MKILFCQLRNHGDIIRTFPLMDAIKRVHPEWKIGYTCFHEMMETCRLCNSIDDIIPQERFSPVVDTQGGTRILDCSILAESIDAVRKQKYDIYVDLHGVFQSAVFGALCGIQTRLGRSEHTTKDGAHYFYTDICEIQLREINRMERHFKIINRLFPEITPIQSKSQTNMNGKILIFPGSSRAGVLKRWSIDRYIIVGEKLMQNYEVEYVIGPEENELGSQLLSRNCNNVRQIKSWRQTIEVIKSSSLVLGNDGAYLHIAIWKKVPVVMLCGPTSPTINGVWKYGEGSAIGSSVECKCANAWGGCCDKDRVCMNSITVDTVLEEVAKYV